jgi:hypothetical protein
MLNEFLEALHSTEMKKQASRELVETLKNLPNEELFNLANGNPSPAIKLAYVDDPSNCGNWLDKYKGTPLFEQAVGIEEELLQIEAKQQEMREADHMNREALYDASDRLRLQKRVLDLQLVRAAEPQSSAPEEELEAAESAGLEMAQQAHETEQAQKAAPPEAKSPAPPAPPAAPPSEKEASARDAEMLENLRNMDKLARVLAREDFKKLSAPDGFIPAISAVGGGLAGASLGHAEGETAEGAARGAIGGAGGAQLGGVAGRALAGLSVVPAAYRAVRQGRASGNLDVDAIRAALLPTAQRRADMVEPVGQALGGGAGYHLALSKYNNPPAEPVEEKTPVATKEANLLGAAVGAGKNLLTGAKAAIPGISQGAQRLGSAVQNGGLTGGLKAMGRMGANFAKQNPLAAAGIAGGAGLATGAALS